MEIRFENDRWLARKNKKAKTWEDITDIIKTVEPDFWSVMGKSGRTSFHSYLGKIGNKWVEMHGVSSMLEYWGEKKNLIQWAVDKAVDYIEENNDPFDDSGYSSLLKEARSAHKRSLEESGNHGTDKHALVEEWILGRIKGEDVFNEEIKDFIEWAVSSGVTFLESEKPLRSKKLWCAGTTDFICEIDGKRYVGDLKTSKWVSFKHFLQCGAYALFYEEMGLGKIDGILIAHLPRDGGFNIHIDKDVDNYKNLFASLVTMVKADKNKSYELYS